MPIQIVVSVSNFLVSDSPAVSLVTFSLGSCLGLTAFDPQARIGGLIHCLLPKGNPGSQKFQANPAMYVNIGVATMLRQLMKMGADKDRLVLKAAGCARLLNVTDNLDMGAKNYQALLEILKILGLSLAGQHLGGSIPRAMCLRMDSGKVSVTSSGNRWEI